VRGYEDLVSVSGGIMAYANAYGLPE